MNILGTLHTPAGDQDINLKELRQQLLGNLTIVLIAVAGFSIWYDLGPDFPSQSVAVWGALFALGIVSFALKYRYPRIASHTLVIGCTLGLIYAMWLFDDRWIPLLGVPLIIISGFLVTRAEVLIVPPLLLASHLFIRDLDRAYPQPELDALLIIGMVVSWFQVAAMFSALEWAYRNARRVSDLLEEARNRQAELNHTLKSLETAIALQRRAQQELILARQQADEARRAKERFLANISHEIRTPLNLILGFSQVMYLTPDVYGAVNWTPELKRDTYHLYRNSQYLLQMISDILDLSRIDMAEFALNKEATPLSPLLAGTTEIAQALFEGESVKLVSAIPDDLPVLEVDRTRVRQVVLNLLTNARRFTDHGTVSLEATCADGFVTVQVKDTGKGIPADKLPYVFDEYYQADHVLRRSHAGAGLGLTISKRFVESHGGHIGATSEMGKGSTFFFRLPLYPANHRFTNYDDLAEQQREQPCVIVVDSDSKVPEFMSQHLEGITVVPVTNRHELAAEVDRLIPKAIIHNVAPHERHRDSLLYGAAMPQIVCSLPSKSWLASEVNIIDFLTKPVLSGPLLQSIKQCGGYRRVLVADDDRGFCQLVERILHSDNPDTVVHFAYTGLEALSYIDATPPDVLLLDLTIPEKSGSELLASMNVRPHLAQIPVILVTGVNYGEEMLREHQGRITILQSDGLRPALVMKYLKAILADEKAPH